jgi:hypothetical protein
MPIGPKGFSFSWQAMFLEKIAAIGLPQQPYRFLG